MLTLSAFQLRGMWVWSEFAVTMQKVPPEGKGGAMRWKGRESVGCPCQP